jgi:hypothetical protein
MKSLIHTAAIAAIAGLIALPIASFAQTGATGDKTPASATQQQSDANHTSGYGGVADGSTQSGAFDHPQYDVGLKSIYVGH